jgi:hypothetical protein
MNGRRFASSTSVLTFSRLQWAPTRTVHDPNPPINLEDPPASSGTFPPVPASPNVAHQLNALMIH